MNAWAQFRALLPQDPLLVGEVIEHNADGTSFVTLPGNITIRVQGQTVAIGLMAFVQSGRIQGEAPSLTTYSIAV